VRISTCSVIDLFRKFHSPKNCLSTPRGDYRELDRLSNNSISREAVLSIS
jgi:hypothetical protein